MQGKRKDQVEFSYKVCAIGIVGIVAIAMVLGLWNWMEPRSLDERPPGPNYNYWTPTEDDLIMIDSLHNQVRDIEEDVNDLNVSVTRIDRKLDDMIDEQNKEDATLYNDEYQMWITGEGDTIYE